METVKQQSARPTNKLAASTILYPIVTPLVDPAVQEFWAATMADRLPAFTGPAMTALVGGLVAGLVSYQFVKDRPNVATEIPSE